MSLRLQIAIARAKLLVAHRDFHGAVARLVAAKVAIESAIAYVARLFGRLACAS